MQRQTAPAPRYNRPTPVRLAIEQLIRQFAAAGRAATALGEAARWGRLDLVQELLATGLDVNARGDGSGGF